MRQAHLSPISRRLLRLESPRIDVAEYLAGFGVEVRYMQEYKVQHKKLVLVDNQTLWIGSANLTTSAMAQNEEFNARTSAPQVLDAANKDFQGLWNLARPAGELNK
ncbi:MAG: phospholipase D family protein [Kiritimatiellia bacterium]